MRKSTFKSQPKKKTKGEPKTVKPHEAMNGNKQIQGGKIPNGGKEDKSKADGKESDPLLTADIESDDPDSSKPQVLLVSMNGDPLFDSYYARFYDKVLRKASIQRASSAKPIFRYLKKHNPKAIILHDSAIAWKKDYARVVYRIIAYVRAGGTLVCANRFSANLSPFFNKKHPKLPLFRIAGLQWEFGDYYVTALRVNKEALPQNVRSMVPKEIIATGTLLDKVQTKESWYIQTNESISSALIYEGKKPQPEWTQIAFARVGEGYIGYVGDLNADGVLDEVILAMCGFDNQVNQRDAAGQDSWPNGAEWTAVCVKTSSSKV